MVLSLFDRSGHIRDSFINAGYTAISLDINPGYNGSKVDIVTDILFWDYRAYNQNHFNFITIALPCQCYSIASGGKHFRGGKIRSSQAVTAINILITVYQITQYFGCNFIIENPSGGLINNPFFKSFFNLNVTRLTLSNFGFPTQKKTDLFYNFNMLLMVPITYRCNGRYASQKLDNLSYNKRVTYPIAFCEWLVECVSEHL